MNPGRKLLIAGMRFFDRAFDTDYHIKLHNRAIGFHTADYRFSPSQIALIHLPKTAGTTAHTILSQDTKGRFVNLGKHRPVSHHCPPGQFKYLTIARNPLGRVWSYYQMVLRKGPAYPYNWLARKGLERFLARCWEARNAACRYYSGRMAEPNRAALESALENLDRFDRVIQYDNFVDEFVAYARNKRIPVSDLPHARKSSYAKPTSDELDLIARFNRLDCELFQRFQEPGFSTN